MTDEQLQDLAVLAQRVLADTAFAEECDANGKAIPPKLQQNIFDEAQMLAHQILEIVYGVVIDDEDDEDDEVN